MSVEEDSNSRIDIREDDHHLVLRLIANDDAAWAYVKDELVDPLVAANVKGMRDMLIRHSIDVESVVGKVYEGLSARNWEAIRNFRFGCRFKSFMYWRVYDAVQRLVREVSRREEKDPLSLDASVESEDGNSIDHEIPDPNSVEPIRQILIKESVAHANNALGELWGQNPTYALVLLMRNDLALPTQDVAVLLDRKPNTVDQINIRAQAALRKIRDVGKSKIGVSFYPSSNL